MFNKITVMTAFAAISLGLSGCGSDLLEGGDDENDGSFTEFEAELTEEDQLFIDEFLDGSTTDAWTFHDPSRILEFDDQLWMTVTGKENTERYQCGFELWRMPLGAPEWLPAACILEEKPNWVSEYLPLNDGAFWAPSIYSVERIYYSVSSGFDDDAEKTCIGMVSVVEDNDDVSFVDAGRPVVCSQNYAMSTDAKPSAIDPATFIDDDGKSYLIFGGGHIYLTELDHESGFIANANNAVYFDDNRSLYQPIAAPPRVSADGEENAIESGLEPQWIEAPYLIKRQGYYYLFVNWYACCNGADSTYQIRVGRTDSLEKPFLDREGVPMLEGGGTLVLTSQGDENGPGHVGVLSAELDEASYDVMSYHYYPTNGSPWAALGTRLLTWEDGWPVVEEESFDLAEFIAELFAGENLDEEEFDDATQDGLVDHDVLQGEVLLLGDSVMAWNREEGESVGDALQNATGKSVVNVSVGGAVMLDQQGAGDLIPEQYVDGDWAWVVFNGGANDLAQLCGCDRCDSVLDDLVTADGQQGRIVESIQTVLQETASRVAYVGYYHLVPNADSEFDACVDEITVLNQRMQSLADQVDGAYYVSTAEIIDGQDAGVYDPDLVHPSALGARLIGDQIAEVVSTAEASR